MIQVCVCVSTVRVGRKVWHIMKGKNCVTVGFVMCLYVLCVTHVLTITIGHSVFS